MATAPPKSLTEVAQELRADLVLQGSLRRTGDSVRVAATLLDATTQERLWSADDVSHVRDVLTLQHGLAASIARVAGRGARRARELPSPERAYLADAHAAYLKGAYYQAHWRLPEAIESFTQAVTIDPSHAPAHAGLSRAYYFMAFFGDIPPGIALGAMRRSGESLEATEAALALDPANPMLISCLGWHSLFDRRSDEAILYATEANAMMPDQWAQVILGWALLGHDRPSEALEAFNAAAALSGSAFNQAALGYALATTGRSDDARRVLAELLSRAEDEYVAAYDIATVYAGLGDRDETFRWLRRAAEERSTFFVHLAWDLRFDNVRDDERFRRLVEGDLGLAVPLSVAGPTPAAG